MGYIDVSSQKKGSCGDIAPPPLVGPGGIETGSWGVLGGVLGASWGRLWADLGLTWGRPEAIMGRLGRVLGHLAGVFRCVFHEHDKPTQLLFL